MSEQSGFFDAHVYTDEQGNPVYDRVYLAQSFAKYFASFIGNGVYAGKAQELLVYQKDAPDMGIRVLPGQAWINGYWYENTEELMLPVEAANGSLGRIDLVVLRWGTSERSINLAIKKGTPAVNAVAPFVQRDEDYYELKLAELRIDAGCSRITQANIVDTRMDTMTCGWVTGVINQVDTSKLFAQWQTAYEEMNANMQIYQENQKAAWERFFANLSMDSVFPIPSGEDVGKIPAINDTADGYILKSLEEMGSMKHGNLTGRSEENQHPMTAITGLREALQKLSPSDHKHSAEDLTVGVLKSERLPTVPILKGGHGGTTRKSGFTNLAFVSNDPVAVATDTPSSWVALGSCFAGVTTLCTINQPTQYGAIISLLVDNFNVHQVFIGADAKIAFRGGNTNSGWHFGWRTLLMESGGEMAGPVKLKGIHLTPEVDYGLEFPPDAEEGRLFWILGVSGDG